MHGIAGTKIMMEKNIIFSFFSKELTVPKYKKTFYLSIVI